jgi:predicted amino acid dehydrogenase
MNIQGTAGTGKSHVIKAIIKMAEELYPGCTVTTSKREVAIAGSTGTAAFGGGDVTLYRLASLPTKGSFIELTGQDKAALDGNLKCVPLLPSFVFSMQKKVVH